MCETGEGGVTRDEMRNWQPDPNATIFQLDYHYVGMGRRKVLKCPISAPVAVHAFADDNNVQCLSITPLGADGLPLAPSA